jgi:soluble lytic murein transglycosylase-like protein
MAPFRGAVRRGARLLIAGAFAGSLALLPSSVVAGDLTGLNRSGTLSADDPSIALTPPPPEPPPATVHDILARAAADQGVDPNLLFAVSYWESGWGQDRVSSEGAVGLLQVMPNTAATAGPILLHRQVDISNPLDNAEVGAALLKDLLDKYDPRTALAAYYQGEPALFSGTYAADTWHYADGILALAAQIAAGQGPQFPN